MPRKKFWQIFEQFSEVCCCAICTRGTEAVVDDGVENIIALLQSLIDGRIQARFGTTSSLSHKMVKKNDEFWNAVSKYSTKEIDILAREMIEMIGKIVPPKSESFRYHHVTPQKWYIYIAENCSDELLNRTAALVEHLLNKEIKEHIHDESEQQRLKDTIDKTINRLAHLLEVEVDIALGTMALNDNEHERHSRDTDSMYSIDLNSNNNIYTPLIGNTENTTYGSVFAEGGEVVGRLSC